MAKQVDEILMASAYYVGKSKILTESIPETLHLMGVVVTEIKVIIEDGSLILGVLKERFHFVAKYRIE